MHKTARLLCILSILSLGYFPGHSQSPIYETGKADTLYSNVLQESRSFWIKYPKYFDPGSHHRYPVVYILDAETQLQALETVCNYYEGHFLPDMILVGISNAENRMRDLTPSAMSMRYGLPVREETGGAEAFARFLEQELIPYVDSTMPASPYRTLIGHSFGGLFTIYSLFTHPHLFRNYVAIDPSLDWDHQTWVTRSKPLLENKDYSGKSLYVSLSAASLHMQNENITMENVMEDTTDYTLFARSIIAFSKFAENHPQNGLRFWWQYYPDDIHGSVSLPTIRDGLIGIFKWYQLESFQTFNDFDTPTRELVELVKKREKKLSENFGYVVPPFEEELFNMLGYMALESGQKDKSFAFFQMALQYYPESPNACDSMADFYLSQKDKSGALRYLAKAYELSGNEYYKQKMEKIEPAY